MASARWWILLALSIGVLVPCWSAACSIETVGQDACQKIEEARCEQASRCGDQLKVTDVAACKRFYRDQCLHGLAIEADPGTAVVDQCVKAIEAAGACPVGQSCVPTTQPVADACEIIKAPQLASACAFLAPAAPVATPDAGSEDDASDAGEDASTN